MAETAEWEPHSGRDDLERDWDGAGSTDEVGVGSAPDVFGPGRAPDHVPQLHRAMSEAAADLDAVEDRLSVLFEREDGAGQASGPVTPRRSSSLPEVPGSPEAVDDDDELFDLFEDGDSEMEESDAGADDEDIRLVVSPVADRRAIIGEYEDDIGGDFAELDAELAAEGPDQPAGKRKRRRFGRRAKGTTAARR